MSSNSSPPVTLHTDKKYIWFLSFSHIKRILSFFPFCLCLHFCYRLFSFCKWWHVLICPLCSVFMRNMFSLCCSKRLLDWLLITQASTWLTCMLVYVYLRYNTDGLLHQHKLELNSNILAIALAFLTLFIIAVFYPTLCTRYYTYVKHVSKCAVRWMQQ